MCFRDENDAVRCSGWLYITQRAAIFMVNFRNSTVYQDSKMNHRSTESEAKGVSK